MAKPIVAPTTPDERRAAKAAAMLEQARSWKLIANENVAFWIVPSQSQPGIVYQTDEHSCSCPDYMRRLELGSPSPCKHSLTVAALIVDARSALEPVAECRDCFSEHAPSAACICGVCDRPRSRGCCCSCTMAYCSKCATAAAS